MDALWHGAAVLQSNTRKGKAAWISCYKHHKDGQVIEVVSLNGSGQLKVY